MVSRLSLTDLSILTYRDTIYKKLGIKDNLILTTLSNITLASIIPMILAFIYKYFKIKALQNYARNIHALILNYNIIELEGDIIKKGRWESYTSFSMRIKGLLYYISKLNIKKDNNNNIKHLKEIIHNDLNHWDDETSNKKNNISQFIVHQDFSFLLKNKLYCKITSVDEEIATDGKQDGLQITYSIQIYSYSYSLNEISLFLDACVEEYKEYLNNRDNQNSFVLLKMPKMKRLFGINSSLKAIVPLVICIFQIKLRF